MTFQKTKKRVSVLFLVPSPQGISPGQRFRFEHYLPLLEKEGITFKVSPFLSMQGRKTLYRKGNIVRKVFALVEGFFRRGRDLFTVSRYSYIYIHRWAATAGPPIFEWLIAKVFRKKIIYDFDDAIWVRESAYNKQFIAIKFLGKIAKICKWAHAVTVGNVYLKEYAVKYNKNIFLLPTVVNTETGHNKIQEQNTANPAVGWTGSFSTLLYLDLLVPALQRLQEKIDFTFYVIADKDPELPLKNYCFIKWNKGTETEDLLKFHIGLMPLTDDEITKGKCGFKAIQYMALGMPALVSAVGVNTQIVDNGINGFICNSESDWEEKIELLLKDKSMRHKMGIEARKKIEINYSVKSTEQLFIGIFK
jgi:glycosyltransferase involved in cell wall biosynthesis